MIQLLTIFLFLMLVYVLIFIGGLILMIIEHYRQNKMRKARMEKIMKKYYEIETQITTLKETKKSEKL